MFESDRGVVGLSIAVAVLVTVVLASSMVAAHTMEDSDGSGTAANGTGDVSDWDEMGLRPAWTASVGNVVKDVTVDSDGFSVAAVDHGRNASVVRLDSEGDTVWRMPLNRSADHDLMDIEQARDGGYIVAGYNATGDVDMLLLKVTDDGELDWMRSYGEEGDDYLCSVAVAENGDYVMAGFTDSHSETYNGKVLRVDSEGDGVWGTTYASDGRLDLEDVEVASDGSIVAVGGVANGTEDDLDGGVFVMDGSGEKQWQRHVGGDGDDILWDVRLHDGDYLVAGRDASSSGVQNPMLARYDASGDRSWQRSYDVAQHTSRAVVETGDGGYAFGASRGPTTDERAPASLLAVGADGGTDAEHALDWSDLRGLEVTDHGYVLGGISRAGGTIAFLSPDGEAMSATPTVNETATDDTGQDGDTDDDASDSQPNPGFGAVVAVAALVTAVVARTRW